MKYMIKKKNPNNLASLEIEEIEEIDFTVADTFFTKLKGLMFKNEVAKAMIFFKCKQIHTFFMKIPIDVYYFDKNMMIIKIDENISPNKIGKYIANAYGVIETSANSKAFDIGDIIVKI
ncbi:MAG: DUF192 domain-containing protein [Acidaminobacteraceae bacterium]